MTAEMTEIIKQSKDKIFFPFLGEDNVFTKGIKLDRTLFTIPGTDIQIYWYGFLIAMGALLAMVYGYSKFKKFGINPDKATDCIIGGMIGAIIGARLYYVVFKLDTYRVDGSLDWKAIISTRDGGLAIYGGLIGALLVAAIIAKIRKISIPALFDVASIGFLIGQAIGRWGNFFNMEAYGNVTKLPWGMTSSKIISELSSDDRFSSVNIQDMVVHPCFLYESIWCIIGFILVNLYIKRRKFDGEIFLMYTAWYGLGRAFIEGLRTDSLYIGNSNVRVSQLLSALLCVISIALIAIIRIKIKQKGGYTLYCDTEESIKSYKEYEEKNSKKKTKIKNVDMNKAIDNAFDDNQTDDENGDQDDEVNVAVLDDEADDDDDSDNSDSDGDDLDE